MVQNPVPTRRLGTQLCVTYMYCSQIHETGEPNSIPLRIKEKLSMMQKYLAGCPVMGIDLFNWVDDGLTQIMSDLTQPLAWRSRRALYEVQAGLGHGDTHALQASSRPGRLLGEESGDGALPQRVIQRQHPYTTALTLNCRLCVRGKSVEERIGREPYISKPEFPTCTP